MYKNILTDLATSVSNVKGVKGHDWGESHWLYKSNKKCRQECISKPTDAKHCSLCWKLAILPMGVDSGLEFEEADPSRSSLSSTRPAAALKYSRDTWRQWKENIKRLVWIFSQYL